MSNSKFYIGLIPTPKRGAEPPASRSDLVEETFLKTSDWQKHGCSELSDIKLAKTQMFKIRRNTKHSERNWVGKDQIGTNV